jgi:hypothetical protein
MKPTKWTASDISKAYQVYLYFLNAQKSGRKYSKARENILLAEVIKKSRGSIEFFHCNISAALDKCGFEYVTGYKPRGNYNKTIDVIIAIDDYREAKMNDSNRGFSPSEIWEQVKAINHGREAF